MAKMTKEQAVAAIQTADTLEAIESVLMPCTKAVMVEAGTEVLGRELKTPASQKKADTARSIASLIVAHRKDEEFKARPFDEKYEMLMNMPLNYQRIKLLRLYNETELEETAQRLGLRTDKKYALISRQQMLIEDILTELRLNGNYHYLRAVIAKGDKNELKEALNDAYINTLNRLARDAGFNDYESMKLVDMREALYVYYTQMQEQETSESEEISSYEIGKQIASLKGKAKAQHAILKSCSEKFLITMSRVFYSPVRVSLDTPDELIKWMCRDVIKVVRDGDYARWLLSITKADLVKMRNVGYLKEVKDLEGWQKFLEEYASPEPEKTPAEQLARLEEDIFETHLKRKRARRFIRMDYEVEANSERVSALTAQGMELVKQYRELRRAISSNEQHTEELSMTIKESPQDFNELEEDCAYVPDWQESLATLDDVPEPSENEVPSEDAAYTSPRKEIVGSVEWYKAREEEISAELTAYEKNRLARHEESYRAKIKQIKPSKQLKSIRPECGVLSREDKEVIRANIAALYELRTYDEMMADLNAVNKITVVSMVYATHYRWLRTGEGFRWEDAQDRPEYSPKWHLINEYVLFVLRDLSSKAHHEYMSALIECEKWRPETPEEYERRQKKEAILARARAVAAASLARVQCNDRPAIEQEVEYAPEYDEECYVPDWQSNNAVLEDEPEPRAPVAPESGQQSNPELAPHCEESCTQTKKPQRGRLRVRLEGMPLSVLESKSKAVFRKICASERQSARVRSDRFLVALIRSYHAIEEVIRLKRAPAYSPTAEEINPPERKCIA